MFLLQLLIFFVSVVFVSISISGYGSLIKLGKKKFSIKRIYRFCSNFIHCNFYSFFFLK